MSMEDQESTKTEPQSLSGKPLRKPRDRRESDRAYYARNKDKFAEYGRAKRGGPDRERLLAKKRDDYRRDREKILAQQKEYALRNKEKLREYGVTYRAKNLNRIRSNKKRYCEKNSERIRQKKRHDYLKNREDILVRIRGCPRRAVALREWRSKNKNWIALYDIAYQHTNKEKYAAARRAYRWSHRAERIFNQRKRKSRLKKSGGSHSLKEWIAKCEDYSFCCAYCGKRGAYLTVDHDIPVSRGGLDDIGNIIPACLPCNQQKNNKTGDEYRTWLLTDAARVKKAYYSNPIVPRRKPYQRKTVRQSAGCGAHQTSHADL